MVSLVLLTASVILGIASTARVATERWPRFTVDGLHRSSSLLVMAFQVVHIVTSVLDSFAPIAWLDAVIPFKGARWRCSPASSPGWSSAGPPT